MRWGVGKGRFRNLTATILSVCLALSFGLVWTFFHRIEPLTIDTSPRSQTASISDRLINTASTDSGAIRQSDIVLFCHIVDSVNAVFNRNFPSQKNRSTKWVNDTLPEMLRRCQVQTRQTIAFMLNQSFTTIGRYRRCESIALRLLSEKEVSDLRHRDILGTTLARVAIDSMRTRRDSTTPNQTERELILEFETQLRDRLTPLELGLSDDTFNFLDLAEHLPSKKERK